MHEIPLALTYDDVLLVPQRSKVSSRSLVNLETRLSPNITLGTPITAANMDTVVSVELAIELYKLGGIAFYPRFLHPKKQLENIKKIYEAGAETVAVVGITDGEFERAKLLVENLPKLKGILIDLSHGHLEISLNFVSKIRQEFPHIDIIAGNIATYEGAKDLFNAGANTVKVGVGPGAACTTRVVTGAGVPQITAILEASKAAREVNGYILADGGMQNSGDIVKALAAGANAVMVGKLLAGTLESPGDIVVVNGKKYKSYHGSASKTEEEKQNKNLKGIRKKDITFVEGAETLVEYQGTVKEAIKQYEGGIRSGFSYSNALNINELHENARFVRITSASMGRLGAHGVIEKE